MTAAPTPPEPKSPFADLGTANQPATAAPMPRSAEEQQFVQGLADLFGKVGEAEAMRPDLSKLLMPFDVPAARAGSGSATGPRSARRPANSAAPPGTAPDWMGKPAPAPAPTDAEPLAAGTPAAEGAGARVRALLVPPPVWQRLRPVQRISMTVGVVMAFMALWVIEPGPPAIPLGPAQVQPAATGLPPLTTGKAPAPAVSPSRQTAGVAIPAPALPLATRPVDLHATLPPTAAGVPAAPAPSEARPAQRRTPARRPPATGTSDAAGTGLVVALLPADHVQSMPTHADTRAPGPGAGALAPSMSACGEQLLRPAHGDAQSAALASLCR